MSLVPKNKHSWINSKGLSVPPNDEWLSVPDTGKSSQIFDRCPLLVLVHPSVRVLRSGQGVSTRRSDWRDRRLDCGSTSERAQRRNRENLTCLSACDEKARDSGQVACRPPPPYPINSKNGSDSNIRCVSLIERQEPFINQTLALNALTML